MKSNQCQKYPVPLIQIAVDSALIVRVSCKSYEAVYLLPPIGSEYGTGRFFRIISLHYQLHGCIVQDIVYCLVYLH